MSDGKQCACVSTDDIRCAEMRYGVSEDEQEVEPCHCYCHDTDDGGCMCGGDDCPECGGDECSYCRGQGWGIVGADWDTDDAINGPYDGEIETCPNCGGSGDAKDMTFW